MAKTCVNFTAAQVLAALRGEVVTVREAVKPQPSKEVIAVDNVGNGEFVSVISAPNRPFGIHLPFGVKCPYAIGTTLWVREAMQRTLGENLCCYGADNDAVLINKKWASWEWEKPRRSPSQMPRWASRLSVTVQSVAVEQVDGGWEWVAEMVKAVQE
jgi:hypothetical protein